MSVGTKQVQYLVEVDQLLQIIVAAITDVKGGKSATQIVADVVPLVIQAISGLGQISDELKDKTNLEMTVAIKLAEILKVLGV